MFRIDPIHCRCLALGAAVSLLQSGYAQQSADWTLIWADEFDQIDGSSPDLTKWSFETGASGWGNNELQYYTSRNENARIQDGRLVIEALAESYEGSDYTSARLRTKGKASWTYGRIEARMKLPRGQGIWPAFWMLGDEFETIGWPQCGEIDIMENIGSAPSRVHGTIHGPGYSGANGVSGSYTLPGSELGEDFHVFGIEWEENRIRWMLDGAQYHTVTPGDLPGGSSWVLNQPQYLLLNLAVGGNWPGSPDGSTVFPQQLEIDYVRVYSRDPSDEANVLENPSFESGNLDGWTSISPNIAATSAGARSGSDSIHIPSISPEAEGDTGAYQDVPALPGDRFRAEAWIFSPINDPISGTTSAFIEISFRDANGEVLTLYQSPHFLPGESPGLWYPLLVTEQLDPNDGSLIATAAELIAPENAAFARTKVVFRQSNNSGGSILFDDIALYQSGGTPPPPGTTVSVDPAADWKGYMNVYELPQNGGGYVFGNTWVPSDLRASFDEATLTLAPNSIGDPAEFWYVGGGAPGNPGNKDMAASFYVEETDSLSGQTVTFTGIVTQHTLAGSHSGIAFIKDFAPDYSSHQSTTVSLEEGMFQVSHDTLPGAGRHVQYGFQIRGANVWISDAPAFGSVKINGITADPYADWISRFDFSDFETPDLGRTGDPDADGKNNFTEFALDLDPTSGTESSKIVWGIEDLAEGELFTITLPIRGNPVFLGSSSKSATIDSVNYVIEGSNDLNTFNEEVIEISPMGNSMPALSQGWSYRTFRLDGEIRGPESRGPSGYLRVKISPSP